MKGNHSRMSIAPKGVYVWCVGAFARPRGVAHLQAARLRSGGGGSGIMVDYWMLQFRQNCKALLLVVELHNSTTAVRVSPTRSSRLPRSTIGGAPRRSAGNCAADCGSARASTASPACTRAPNCRKRPAGRGAWAPQVCPARALCPRARATRQCCAPRTLPSVRARAVSESRRESAARVTESSVGLSESRTPCSK